MEMALITWGQILSCTRFVLSTAEDNELGKVALISFNSPLPHPEWAQSASSQMSVRAWDLQAGHKSGSCVPGMLLGKDAVLWVMFWGTTQHPLQKDLNPTVCEMNLSGYSTGETSLGLYVFVGLSWWTFGHPLYAFVSRSTFANASAKNKFWARMNHEDTGK